MLHDLILRQAGMGICLHVVASGAWCVQIPNEAQPKRASAVLVALEFLDGRVRSIGSVESDDTGAARSTTGFVLNFGLLNLANCGEEFHEILVACGPGELGARVSSNTVHTAVARGRFYSHSAHKSFRFSQCPQWRNR